MVCRLLAGDDVEARQRFCEEGAHRQQLHRPEIVDLWGWGTGGTEAKIGKERSGVTQAKPTGHEGNAVVWMAG